MLVSILATAAAADGGSLGFEGQTSHGGVSWYQVCRAFAVRETAQYNTVTRDGEVLEDAEKEALFACMRQIGAASTDTELRQFIDQFIGRDQPHAAPNCTAVGCLAKAADP